MAGFGLPPNNRERSEMVQVGQAPAIRALGDLLCEKSRLPSLDPDSEVALHMVRFGAPEGPTENSRGREPPVRMEYHKSPDRGERLLFATSFCVAPSGLFSAITQTPGLRPGAAVLNFGIRAREEGTTFYCLKKLRTPSITRSSSPSDRKACIGRLRMREHNKSAFGHRAGPNSAKAF